MIMTTAQILVMNFCQLVILVRICFVQLVYMLPFVTNHATFAQRQKNNCLLTAYQSADLSVFYHVTLQRPSPSQNQNQNQALTSLVPTNMMRHKDMVSVVSFFPLATRAQLASAKTAISEAIATEVVILVQMWQNRPSLLNCQPHSQVQLSVAAPLQLIAP
jgi:hypothetical protein